LLTLGTGAILLAAFERLTRPVSVILVTYGSVPLFFYILHLYMLHLLNRAASMIWPTAEAGFVSVPGVGWIWLLAVAVAIPCWFACRWFAVRKRASAKWWMRYL
jgi:hypothetical protein